TSACATVASGTTPRHRKAGPTRSGISSNNSPADRGWWVPRPWHDLNRRPRARKILTLRVKLASEASTTRAGRRPAFASPGRGTGKQPASTKRSDVSHSAILALEDGTIFRGVSFGAPSTAVGEVVFNTAMSGYQEILSDPSYARQLVCLTTVHVGNTGINPED